jgi:hypothetical protein
MKPADVLYNAFIACGLEPKRKLELEHEYIIVGPYVHVFSITTGKHIEIAVKKDKVADIIKI